MKQSFATAAATAMAPRRWRYWCAFLAARAGATAPTAAPTSTAAPSYLTDAPTATPAPTAAPSASQPPSAAPSVAPTTCTVDPVFCVYTDAVTAYAVDVVVGETQQVFAIPASQRRTWIQLNATADIDLKLETSDGVVLLDYSTGTNWANSLTEYTYAGKAGVGRVGLH